jgi:hypothetical protein
LSLEQHRYDLRTEAGDNSRLSKFASQEVWAQARPEVNSFTRANTANQHLPSLELTDNKMKPDLSQTLSSHALDSVGQKLYQPRSGSKFEVSDVPADFGCASTATNLYFDALVKEGLAKPNEYRSFHEINVTDFKKHGERSGKLNEVSTGDKREGDFIVGISGKDRHIGILVRDGDELKVVHNKKGTVSIDSIADRFGKYQRIHILRPTVGADRGGKPL